MSDNLSRKAKSVYFLALASIFTPVSTALGAYGSANSYDLNPAGYTNSKSTLVVGARQLGQGTLSPNVKADVWTGTAASVITLNNSYYHAFVMGGSFSQYVGGGDLTSGSADNALLWAVTADGSVNAPINLHPSGYSASYAQTAAGNIQAGYGFAASTGFNNHALLWTGTAASAVDLHSFLPASPFANPYVQSYVFGTDGAKQVGYGHIALNGQNFSDRAILWNSNLSTGVDLTPTSGTYQGTYAYGIANNQQFGFVWIDKGDVHAAVWSGTAASFVDINPAGYQNSRILNAAVTLAGTQEVGYANTSGGSDHAALWTGNTFTQDLHAFLPGAPTASRAQSIDVYGNISGYAVYAGQNRAVTWLAGNTYKISNGSGAWNSNINWLSGAAPAAGQDVFLLASDAGGANITYASAAPLSLNRLVIDSVANVAVTMSQSQDSLTTANEFIGYIGRGAYSHSGGTHTVTNTLKLGANAGAQGQYDLSATGNLSVNNLIISATSSLNQTGGTLNATATLNAGTLSLGGIANVGTLDAVTSGTTSAALSAVGATSIAANTIATATHLRQNSLTLHGSVGDDNGKLIIPESAPGMGTGLPAGNDAMVSIVRSINIDNDGANFFAALDLANNDLIIDYTGSANPLDQIEAMVKSGYNNGTWTGKGITSSIAAADPSRFHLAVADNAQLGGVAINNFDGIDTSSHQQIIVKFTWIADINLDGLVNANDAIAFGNFYSAGQTGAHHMFGDLNYDGVINANDAILFSTVYSDTLQHLPEPTSLSLLALGAATLLTRRRRS